MIANEITHLMADCYFAAGHCPWLRSKSLNKTDNDIYHQSKEYKELRKLNIWLGWLSANYNAREDLFSGLTYEQGNLRFWGEIDKLGVSAHTVGVISEYLEVLRLDTDKFKQDRLAGRREVFGRIRELTGKMGVKDA